ncbi:MAG: branched-chain amino acid transporter substrate-binding protein [Acidimicrobiaceae bacterium]|nr:branched-chain amino acid transporter substrate-binding protein [Acidimicrobiaceae bacterium]
MAASTGSPVAAHGLLRWFRVPLWVILTATLALTPKLGLSPSASRQLLLIALLSLVVSGLNLSFGFTGELSFAQPAMYAIGAYSTVIVSMHFVNDVLVCMVVAIAAGLLLGLLSGIPGLRLGGWVLAISSLYLVLLVPDVVSATKEYTGGFQGIGGIPLPRMFGHELGTDAFLAVVIVATAAWFALFRNLVVSSFGDSLAVLRESPILASSLGISVYATKLKVYAISGAPAAMAGAFFGYLDGFVAPETFGISLAIVVLAASILGGSRSVYGAFAGAALLQLGPMQSTAFGDYAFIAYGVFLILAGVLLRRGLVGVWDGLLEKRRARSPKAPVHIALTAADAELPPVNGQRLSVAGVSKKFGGVAALTDVTFDVNPGEIVALIGPNGSGKTTLLNIISGYYKLDEGAVHLGDTAISRLSTHRVARAGIARTFQTPSVPALSVRAAVGSSRSRLNRASLIETMLRLPRYRRAVASDRNSVDAVLAAVGLSAAADTPAQSLPLGTRRMLELARSLAGQPGVLLLDEVASGLDDEEIEELSRIVRAVRSQGGAVLLVEHNFPLVRSLADRVVVLSRGEVVVVAAPDEVAQHPEVLEHYLGQPSVAPTSEAGTPS